MKLVRLISIIVLSAVTLSCPAQKTLSDVSSIKGVTSVFVGKTMLKLAGNIIPEGDAQDTIDISKLLGMLTSIEMVNCDEEEVIAKAQPVADRVLAQYPFELITEAIDDDEKVEISGVFSSDGETITMLLIKVSEDDELTYILLKGHITIEALQSALQLER